MDRYEYMKLPFDIIPQDIIDEYNLTNILRSGKSYIDIWKGVYGLQSSGIISHDRLKNHPEKRRWQPLTFTPGLWTHKSIPIYLTFASDDFEIKYVGKQHAYLNKIIINWDGKFYSTLTIKWDYKGKHGDIPMPVCIDKSLHRFQQ